MATLYNVPENVCTNVANLQIDSDFLQTKTMILTYNSAACKTPVTQGFYRRLFSLPRPPSLSALRPGTMRNVSSAGEPARAFMRASRGLVDSLLWIIKAAVQQKEEVDEKVCQSVCLSVFFTSECVRNVL